MKQIWCVKNNKTKHNFEELDCFVCFHKQVVVDAYEHNDKHCSVSLVCE